MVQRLNVRFLLCVGCGVLVALGLTHLIHALQVRRLQGHLKAEAEKAAAEGELARGALYYRRYLASNPNDLDTQADYGLLLHRQATTRAERWRAYRVLAHVLQRSPGTHRVRLPLAHLTTALGHPADAAEFLEPLRGTLAEQWELEQTLAWCYLAGGRTEAALEAFNRAINHAPERPEPYLQLAELYRRLNLSITADEVLDRMVESNPESARVYQARGEARAALGRFEEAAEDLAVATRLAPEDLTLWLSAAEISRVRQQPTDTRLIVGEALRQHAHHPRLLQLLACVEQDNNQVTKAYRLTSDALARHPDDIELWALKADLAIELGRSEEAEKGLTELGRLRRDFPWKRYLEGRQLEHKRDWVKAARVLEEAVAELARAPVWQSRALMALARSYAAVGDELRRVQAYRRAVLADPAGRQARLGLGLALLENRAPQSAATTLAAVQHGPEPLPQGWLPLARAELEAGHLDRVERALKPLTRPADLAAAESIRARGLAAQGHWGRARSLLEKAAEDHPRSVEVWLARVDVAVESGDLKRAEDTLTEARRQLGDCAEVRLAWARLIARRDGDQGAMRIADLCRNSDTLPPADRLALLAGVEPLLRGVGSPEPLKVLADEWSRAAPGHLGPLLLRFDLAVERRDDTAAQQFLAEVRRIEGEEGVRWRCGQALLAMNRALHGDSEALNQARALLGETSRRQPGWSRLALLEARLADQEGQPAAALHHYQRAFDAGDRFPWVAERLFRLLVQQGKLPEADRVLKLFQQTHRLSPTLARLGAEAAAQRHSWARARELALLAIPPDVSDYRDHLWLAELQYLAGHRDEARAILEKLTRTAAELPEPWIALVRHHLRADKRAEAEAAFKRGGERVRADRLNWLTALCSEELGELERAEAAYRRGLEHDADPALWHERLARLFLYQDEPGRAIPSLRWLAEGRESVPRPVGDWARRMLALSVAGLMGPEPALTALPEKRDEAARLLALNVRDGREALADKRARLMVRLIDPETRALARAELEATRAEAPFTPQEQHRLGLIEAAHGDSGRGRDLLMALIAEHERNGQFLAGYVRLVVQKDPDSARHWLSRLEKVEPGSRRTRALKRQLGQSSVPVGPQLSSPR